jgi:hypothetical protein
MPLRVFEKRNRLAVGGFALLSVDALFSGARRSAYAGQRLRMMARGNKPAVGFSFLK